MNKYYCGFIVGLLVLIVLICYQIFNQDIRMIKLSSTQQQQVNKLLEKRATRCIGTYLIDLPAEFKVNEEGYFDYQRNYVITIATKQQYLPPFKQMIARREQELKNTKPVDPRDGDYLKAIYSVDTNDPEKMQGIVFERMESIGTADILRVLEGYRWQDEVTLKIEMKAQNGLGEQYTKDRQIDPESYGNNVPQKLTEMYKLFDRIKLRDDLTIPTTPGFCFLHGFMQGEDREWKDMGFIYLHNTIDNFYFSIDYNDFKEGYALLDKPEGYVTQGRGHTIYKGTRKSNGLLLEEWIAKGQFFLDKKGFYSDDWGYVFSLGIHMTDPTYKTPQLRLEMYYKPPLDPRQAYSKDQLMVFWQEITNSIRIRESSFENE
ncbi:MULTISPECIES: T6SS immunity protein Tli4 family protein [unclassified Gilliamella]|uniref:T6SS immunity protein Tli4 family protein n=1 Tax=unclassified Gilliamella TaxID=2685620 RepID=UPI00080EAAE6|nr:T6SS immunity protein Tli4 family protein [Gilliamella apicola]OCG21175.1 hypothetical protein A9G22_10125 [Gilliamella apicola]OCG22015.1 hypothetical protein A9G23_00585 [Gilliamella apicola]